MLHFLSHKLEFPDVNKADKDGMLAIGGDLSTERLLLAYRSGIFPWYNEDEPPVWWCPDPRFVLFPNELNVSKSMKQLIKKNLFEFRINTDFPNIIASCKNTYRPGQDGTWISQDVLNAYTQLHQLGYAHSAEAWMDGKLVGGLYGIRMGNIFFGESMFSHVANASKFAFIQYVKKLQEEGVILIDCQVYTAHLESLGARMIARNDFIKMLEQHIR